MRQKSEFPNLIVLAEICLLLPLQTADVDHGFSDRNLTKTAPTNKLREESLDNLTTIEGPLFSKFDFHEACQVCHKKKNRRVGKPRVQRMYWRNCGLGCLRRT